MPRVITVLNDKPVDALFVSDAHNGTVVECSRCEAHTVVKDYVSMTRLFAERCSYCGARLRYPDGARW